MIIGGLQKFTLVDFPGIAAAVLFAQGCNLRCPFCHNPELIETANASSISLEDVFTFLKKRTGKLDGVVITGGEPCLQSDLPELVRQVKSMGFKVKLDTNGSFPDRLESLLQSGLDYVAMDVKAAPDNYPAACGIAVQVEKIQHSISLILSSGAGHEFRTTLAPSIHSEKDIRQISEMISGARLYALQALSGYETFDPGYKEMQPFDDSIMESFQKIASEYVQRCVVR